MSRAWRSDRLMAGMRAARVGLLMIGFGVVVWCLPGKLFRSSAAG